MFKTLEELIAVIRQRKDSVTEGSYTKKLLEDKKLNIKKVKEEIAELIDAIEKDTNKVYKCKQPCNGEWEEPFETKLKQINLNITINILNVQQNRYPRAIFV